MGRRRALSHFPGYDVVHRGSFNIVQLLGQSQSVSTAKSEGIGEITRLERGTACEPEMVEFRQ